VAHDPETVESVADRRRGLFDDARPDAVARQHAKGKLTARERVALLLDDGTEIEYGGLVTAEDDAGINPEDAPADGVLSFTGLVDGRPVVVLANDFTVTGGSVGMAGARKMLRVGELAVRSGMPYICLYDGGGHRMQEIDSRDFASGGPTPFPDMARLSGWAPHIAAVMGPAFAGVAGAIGMADFVPMVSGTSSIGIAGPSLVRAATGENLTPTELGGSEVQARYGLIDVECDDDLACIATVREYLSFFPTNASQPPPILRCDDSIDRRCPDLRHLVPGNRREAYDVRPAVEQILDNGECLELKPTFAPNAVTVLGRIGGRPVGVIANQPNWLAGALDGSACEKLARFAALCDAYGLPIISFIDTPGLLCGSAAEAQRLASKAARVMMTLGHATVPVISIVLRKSYGLGYGAMAGGRTFDAEGTFIWPSAEVSVMGIEGTVDLLHRRELEAADDPAALRAELIDRQYRNSNPFRAASGFGIDDVIDPADTRRCVARVLMVSAERRVAYMPPKRHPIPPL
jgi:acetyl-CoA carboxylase carboxyltransferase component